MPRLFYAGVAGVAEMPIPRPFGDRCSDAKEDVFIAVLLLGHRRWERRDSGIYSEGYPSGDSAGNESTQDSMLRALPVSEIEKPAVLTISGPLILRQTLLADRYVVANSCPRRRSSRSSACRDGMVPPHQAHRGQ
jgi:hypothetical protein